MKAQLRVPGAVDARARREVVDAMRRLGVRFADGGDTTEASDEPHLVLVAKTSAAELECLAQLAAGDSRRVLVVVAPGASLTADESWRLLGHGASDVIAWHGRRDPGRDVLARLERWAAVDEVLRSDLVRHHLIGCAAQWTRLLRQIIEVAAFTDTAVLLTGESGTGKEMVARLIHTLDRRADKGQLVVLDCTTVVGTLSGSEFFGHERGAFTGAVAARDGAFARANKGTLFLDEIGDLALGLQAELLRVIQEGTYKRVGSDTWRHTKFRLVSATNRRLDDAQASGEFRADLYHRIAAWHCELPPLRERPDDILALARHFLAQHVAPEPDPAFDPAVEDYIRAREFRGNVRELRQLVSRIAVRHVGTGPITIGDIPESDRGIVQPDAARPAGSGFESAIACALADGLSLTEISKRAHDTAVDLALLRCGGSSQRAAELLRVSDRTIQLRKKAKAAAP